MQPCIKRDFIIIIVLHLLVYYHYYSYSTAVPDAIDWDDPRVASVVSELSRRAHGGLNDNQVSGILLPST